MRHNETYREELAVRELAGRSSASNLTKTRLEKIKSKILTKFYFVITDETKEKLPITITMSFKTLKVTIMAVNQVN